MFPLCRVVCPASKRVNLIGSFTFLFMALSTYVLLMLRVDNEWTEELLSMKSYADPSVKKIALWTTLWGKDSWGTSNIVHCGVNVTCQLYDAKRHPLRYDALVFHGWDPQRPPSERSPHQAYIMFLHESPAYESTYVPGNTFYNWTMTYSHTSDFLARYFTIRQRQLKPGNASFHAITKNNNAIKSGNQTSQGTLSVQYSTHNLPGLEAAMQHVRHEGEKIVFWVVSHCNTSGRREIYVDALKQHIPVDVYGKCGQDCKIFEKHSGLHCHDFLARTGQYKFYLSFESSACRDYITEKVYHPLKQGLVPIVYGGLSTEEYMAMLPPGSFIDVRNFKSPKHLAEYLVYLDGNDKAYLAYHAWREKWDIGNVWWDTDNVWWGTGHVWCEVCHALHNVDNVPPRNINWGKCWNPATECDDHLLEKVLGRNA